MKQMLYKLGSSIDRRTVGLIVVTIAITLLVGSGNPTKFYSMYNIQSMLRQMSEIGIFSLAMFLVVISGGFTLSAVALGNFSAICGGVIIQGIIFGDTMVDPSLRLVIGIVVTFAIGMLGGALNGYFVARFGLTTILVTSATLLLFKGTSLIITQGESIMGAPPVILELGAGSLFGVVPYLFILLVVSYLLVGLFLQYTSYGEQCRLLGTNEVANKYSGNSNFKTLMYSYILSGVASAIGGIVVYSRMGVLRADYGETLTSTALIVVLLGGAWLIAGGGKLSNIFISIICLQVIASGTALAGWSPFLKNTLWGIFLMFILVTGSNKFVDWYKGLFRKYREKHSDKVQREVMKINT